MFKSISICSKVLKRVSHVFKSVPKSPTCVQTIYNCPDKLDRGEGAISYQDVGCGGHQTGRDKFSSDSDSGHQRLEYSVRQVGDDQNSLQRGRMDNDLTTFFIRDQAPCSRPCSLEEQYFKCGIFRDYDAPQRHVSNSEAPVLARGIPVFLRGSQPSGASELKEGPVSKYDKRGASDQI